jgi:hypothetical protein
MVVGKEKEQRQKRNARRGDETNDRSGIGKERKKKKETNLCLSPRSPASIAGPAVRRETSDSRANMSS